jgi:hypothetical protein
VSGSLSFGGIFDQFDRTDSSNSIFDQFDRPNNIFDQFNRPNNISDQFDRPDSSTRRRRALFDTSPNSLDGGSFGFVKSVGAEWISNLVDFFSWKKVDENKFDENEPRRRRKKKKKKKKNRQKLTNKPFWRTRFSNDLMDQESIL